MHRPASCVAILLFVCVAVIDVHALTVTVDSNLDTVDAADGVTTLREAILATSAFEPHTISLAIGSQTITLMSALPVVNPSLTLLGGGATLDGSFAGPGAVGLPLSQGVVVESLTIVRFGSHGITTNGCITLDDVRIGVDAAGEPAGNGGDGVLAFAPCASPAIIRNSTIGSNGGDGIDVVDSVEIEQSFIGTTAAGDDRGNGGAGIRLRHQSFPGATGVITGNTIAFNDGPGIAVVDALTDHRTFRVRERQRAARATPAAGSSDSRSAM